MEVRKYLTQKGFSWNEIRRPSGMQAVFNCPFCGDREKKFAVSLDTGAFQCLRKNNCGLTGSFYQLQKWLGDSPVRIDSDNFYNKKQVKKNYKRPTVKPAGINDKTWQFFKGRKITEKTLKDFKIANKDDNTIIFPYFKDGQLIGVKYRLNQEKKFWKEKDTEPALYNIDMIDNYETLYICEGEIDCLSLYEYGIKGVSLPSGVNDLSWIEHQWEWVQQFKYIYLLLDQDNAGQEAAETIVNRLGKWRCYNVTLPKKDINECLMSGIESDIIFTAILKAKEYSHEKLKTPVQKEQDILDVFANKEKLKGIETPFNKLNNLLKGWRSGEVTAWTGRNGSGKSTLLSQVFLDLAEKSQRCCIFSGELKIARLMRWAIIQHLKNCFPDETAIKNSINFYSEYWWLYDSTESVSSDDLLNGFEFAARKYGVTNFLIDSLMKIKLDSYRELQQQKEFIQQLSWFAKEFNSHIHIIAHPRKSDSDNQVPDKVDVKGTSEITDLVDNFITVWRANDETKDAARKKGKDISDTVLFLKKNREWGHEGKIYLNFNNDHKLFYEDSGLSNPDYFQD